MNRRENDMAEDNPAPDISVVIVSFNTAALTRQCLEKVQACAADLRCEVIVVDNASHDGSADMVAAEFPRVRLIRLEKNRGFAGGNNPGIRAAKGRYILLLNSDAFIVPGVFENTVAYMDANPDIGVLGCRLTNPDGTLQPSARMLPGALNKVLHITGLASRFPTSRFFGRVDFSWWDHGSPRSVGWVVGAFFMIRRPVVEQIGGLDERYFLYFEEIDFCRTARRAGWDVVFYSGASVVHLGGQSSTGSTERRSASGSQLTAIRITSELRYYRKWSGPAGALLIAGIEIAWNCVVWCRNVFRRNELGAFRRREAAAMIGLIAITLFRKKLGAFKQPQEAAT
jgi:GT2 family glycosyltransferase